MADPGLSALRQVEILPGRIGRLIGTSNTINLATCGVELSWQEVVLSLGNLFVNTLTLLYVQYISWKAASVESKITEVRENQDPPVFGRIPPFNRRDPPR